MTAESRTIQVLLATYNGESFLQEQIDSILSQTYPDVTILARDDASRDSTRVILERNAATHPQRFMLMPPDTGTGNAKWNFMRLMQASTAPYVALADQDDVWLPDKLTASMHALRELEQQHGTATPLLIFSDLTVTDRDLKTVHPSFWAHQHIDADHINSLSHILAQNVVTGCTALMNRALLERSLRMPDAAFMHDWWIALTVAAFGRARALHGSTVLYRQHGKNVVGAAVHQKPNLIPRFRYHEKRRAQWEMSARQAMAFLALHHGELPGDKQRVLEAYTRCETSLSRFVRVATYVRFRFFQKGLRANLAVLWYLWDMKAAKRMDAGIAVRP